MTDRSLPSLRRLLKKYRAADVLQFAAALQLLPESLDYAVRLEMLALVAATTKSNSRRQAPTDLLVELLDESWIAELAQFEEPPQGAFLETVTFHGGGFRVFAGRHADATYVLRTFLEVFTRERLVPEYSRFAVEVLSSALSLSDLVAARSDMPATVSSVEGDDDLTVPEATTLERLRKAVSFSTAEAESFLASRSMSLRMVGPLLIGIGNVPSVMEVDRNPLSRTPIVQAEGRIVVAVPSALHTAAIHHALVEADRRTLGPRVAGCLLEIVWRDVLDATRRMHWYPSRLHPPSQLALPNSADAFFVFDVDKVAYVALLCDPLNAYTASPSSYSIDNEILTARLAEVEQYVAELQPTQCELQIVIIIAGVGRECAMNLDLRALRFSHVLAVSAHDLETMSLLEKDALGLWKFQRAASAFREGTQVAPSLSGPLNEFWYYLDREHSYYFSEEAVPDFMMFDEAAAGLARQKVAVINDRHAVVGPSPRTIVEITRCQQDLPIYARRERSVLREFCVDTSTIPIWIVCADERDPHGERVGEGPIEEDGAIHLACRATAYWAAELLDHTHPLVGACRAHERLLVRIHVDDLASFGRRPERAPIGPMVKREVNRAACSVQLTLTNVFAWAAGAGDNAAERALALEYLRALYEIAEWPESDATQPQRVVDEVAPLGFKKQITFTLSVDEPQLDPRALPDPRVVQRADEQFFMDSLGRRMLEALGIAPGELDPTAAHAVLHRGVADTYGEIQKRIASLCPVGLLESLLAANEAIVWKEAEKRITLAPRIACSQRSDEMLKEVRDESAASAKAAIAMRFLIEYVAARPPSGARSFSTSVLDELVAMASMLVYLGTASDVAEFEIGAVTVAALASGRIHVDPAEYNAAMLSYSSIGAGRDLARARGERQRSRVPEIREQLRRAIASVYGLDSDSARSVIGALYDIGEAQHPSVAVFRRIEIEQQVADRCGLAAPTVRAMLEKLTLSPRPDFLRPSRPYDKHDVYPWRFGRGLSLLQRPLVLRERDGIERLSWGQRQLWASWHHAGYRLAHGSWRAPSPATKEILSEINNARGSAFEEEVAGYLRNDRPEFVIRERISKLAGSRIQAGDIDVLVAVPARKRLWLLECKDLSSSATPWSIKHQIEELFIDGPNAKSIQTKHEARLTWAREHLPGLLQLVGESGDGWEVKAAIVTSAQLLGPLLATARMPVIPWHDLSGFEL